MKNPINYSLKQEVLIIFILLLVVVSGFIFYGIMPERIPIHWNIQGGVDGYGSKEFGCFGLPAIMVGVYLMMIVLPYLDPKKDRYRDFAKAYWVIRLILVLYFAVIYFASSLAAIGYNIPVGRVVVASIAVLFVIMGNYLSKIKPNWFVGIRTPWTLSNEEVWKKTHQLSGKLFFGVGLILLFSIVLPINWVFTLMMMLVGLLVAASVLYSYLLFRKLDKNK